MQFRDLHRRGLSVSNQLKIVHYRLCDLHLLDREVIHAPLEEVCVINKCGTFKNSCAQQVSAFSLQGKLLCNFTLQKNCDQFLPGQ